LLASVFLASSLAPQPRAQDPAATPVRAAHRAVAKPEPLGDFVPCLLDGDQQWAMRGMANPYANPETAPVTSDQAKTISDRVSSAITEVSPDFAAALAKDSSVSSDNLIGLNRSQVQQRYTASIETFAAKNLSSDAGKTVLTKIESAKTSAVNQATNIAAFKRPADVSCSISIMGYKETKAIFGAAVADNYLAIQVTVRNLNTQNDFLIHDVQAAVDTGVDEAYFGRFQSGRDKLLVRAVVQRGQVTDPRNIIINTLQVAGAIAAVPTAGMAGNAATAVAVFTGQFVPGIANIFPDPTITYTNHINDLTFSSSASSKTIVPVNGSVPFVTFIAQKPIQELPFAWCGYTTQERRWKKGSAPGYYSYGRALESCTDPGQIPPPSGASGVPAYKSPYNPATLKDQAAEEWDDLPYKKWKGAALRILEQNTFVVVGGTHIKDAGNLALNNLDCPTFPNGHVDISQTTGGMVVCKVTGAALAQVKSVNFEKGTSKLAGKISPASDGNSAQLTFDPSVLADGDGEYSLFLVDSTGAETDSQNSVQLSKQPIVTSLDKTEIAATGKPAPPANGAAAPKAATTPITLKGKNLNLIIGVSFKDGGGSALKAALGELASGDASLTVNVETGGISAGDYAFAYTIEEVPGKNLPSTPLPTLKVTAAPGAPAPAPAAAVTAVSFADPKSTSVQAGKTLPVAVKVTATGGATPTGSVQLYFGTTAASQPTPFGKAQPVAKGAATLTFTAPSKGGGPYYLAAAFRPTEKTKFQASTTKTPLTVTVAK
jgi:hypothetical protein